MDNKNFFRTECVNLRDDSITSLLRDSDAFINHPDEHERVMAAFDHRYCQKFSTSQ